jgi:hypothetical protein
MKNCAFGYRGPNFQQFREKFNIISHSFASNIKPYSGIEEAFGTLSDFIFMHRLD